MKLAQCQIQLLRIAVCVSRVTRRRKCVELGNRGVSRRGTLGGIEWPPAVPWLFTNNNSAINLIDKASGGATVDTLD